MGAEQGFRFTLERPGSLFISTDYPETTVDTILYLRTCLEGAPRLLELSCDDGNGPGSSVRADGLDPGTYYVFVDTAGPGMVGDFLLTVTPVR
jgi:hypothetical protein